MRYGYETPRIYTPPLRELKPAVLDKDGNVLEPATSQGYAAIEFAEEVIGIDLFPWQRWLLIHALELREDGSFRFRNVVVLIARQNGKSTLSQVLSLFFLFVLGARLVLGTAQDLDTAEEVWDGALELIEGNAELHNMCLPPRKVNGGKTIRLASGERYKVKAASRRAGRGLSGDLILLDELREHTSWEAWAAITKTTMARANAQVWALSNAGDVASVVLRYLRKMAHLALHDPDGIVANEDPNRLLDSDRAEELAVESDETLGIFEWSAPPGCSTDDRDGWAQANPSLGHAITERTIASAKATDPEWIFRCLDVATPVLTQDGWKSMGALTVQDRVKGTNGLWIDVIGTSPVHLGRDCYRVTFNDGRSVVCDDRHLWAVHDRRRPSNKKHQSGPVEILRTVDLIERGVTYHNPATNYDVRNFSLPAVEPLDGPDVNLPADPYLLGLWLGDGTCHASVVYVEDRDEAHIRAAMEARGAVITTRVKDSEHCFRLGFNTGQRGDFTAALHELGVHSNKHVPDVYFTASHEQRLELLRGLLDSDGTVSKRSGRCTFTNTNAKLVEGVRTLVRSLGWKTSDLEPGRYGKPHWLPRYDVAFTTRPDEACPVTIPRKAANIRAAQNYRDVRPTTIASIEQVPSVPVRCIQVDATNSLFLAGDLVPTHNTEVLCQWSDGTLEGPFPSGTWDDGIDGPDPKSQHPGSQIAPGSKVGLCVDVAWDRTKSHIAAAGFREDHKLHVEIIASRGGTDWVKGWFTDPDHPERLNYEVMIQPGGPAGSLIDELVKAGVKVVEWKGEDIGQSCGRIYDLVVQHEVLHRPQPILDVAAATAVTKPLGDTWAWDRKKSPVDAAPLVAITGAVWLISPRPEEGPPLVHAWPSEEEIKKWEEEALT